VAVFPFHLVSASQLGGAVLRRVRRWRGLFRVVFVLLSFFWQGPIDFLGMR
jgi:hypothetical protein